MIDLYSASVFIFLFFLLLLIWRDRKNLEIKYFVIMRRSKRGIQLIDSLARHKLFWKFMGILSILVALYLMSEGLVTLLFYVKAAYEGLIKIPALSLILPSPKPTAQVGPGYVLIPFWFWVLTVVSIVVPHEFFHGIMSRVEGVKIKSMGFILVFFLPGAFVEPDEKKLKKLGLVQKLSVFCMGSFANFLVYLLTFFFLSHILWPSLVPGPIKLVDVNETSPAYLAGLRKNMIITEINGTPIRCTYEEFLSGKGYLGDELKDVKPGDVISVIADGKEFRVVLGKNPKNETLPYLGITYSPYIPHTSYWVFIQLLTWIWSINYAVAVFNLLPIYPLDGGLILEAFAEKVFKEKARKFTYAISILVLIILLLDFFLPLRNV